MQSQDEIICLKDVSLIRENRIILRNVNFSVNRGDFIIITGPNGGGKTSLLRMMLKLIKPSSGNVAYNNPGAIGYLPQKNMIDSHFPISVKEVVASGLITSGVSKTESVKLVNEMLEKLSLSSHADYPIGRISGGQLQRTLLGRAIISSPKVLFLDEPLSFLDKHFEHVVYDILREIKSSTTILLVSHEITGVAAMANRHIIVDKKLHECGASHHHGYLPDCD